jgi:ParB family chromosome partitioning protein
MAGKDNKLTSKAAKLDFSALPGFVKPNDEEAAAARPKTAPGAMMAFANEARSDLLRENEELRSRAAETDALQGRLDEALADLGQWEGAHATRMLDPKRIKASRYANRHELAFSSAEFEKTRAEIANAGGNVQPIKVRPIGKSGEYEIVYGHRRHRACLELGLPVLAMIESIDDQALFVEMDRENRARADLSAWEQGMMYRRALDTGLYPSARKLADAVGVDLGHVGKAIALAKLPAEVVEAFASPLDLQYRWAKPLTEAHQKDPKALVARARAIKARVPRPSAKVVLEQLLDVAGQGVGPSNPPERRFEVSGKRAATLTAGADAAGVLRFEPGVLTPSRREALEKFVETLLK